ncbi:MAG: UDP-N-acetylmuramate dehydrogenase [Magnetospiraceae bacterium]
MAAAFAPVLIDRLPTVRGRYTANADLSRLTWFKVGGPAEVIYRPADMEDLVTFLRGKPDDVPVTVIGVGSNLLVRDGGVPGVVIRLGRAFATVHREGTTVSAGAGALDLNVALSCRDWGIAGLEFLSGIPGTIGGALRMNAGAFGGDTQGVFEGATAVDGAGNVHRLTAADMDFSYRHVGIPEDWIFTGAVLRGTVGESATIGARIEEIQAERAASQPQRQPTGGSTFANPEGARAWELIDAAGCRGLRIGGAMVSEKHCNFLINTGTATAADLETLGETVRRRVRETSGVDLRWEIRRIGEPLTEGSP